MKYRLCCGEDAHAYTLECSVAEFSQLKKEGSPCPSCDKTSFPVFTPKAQFVMKGDVWSDKNYRLKEFHQRKSDRLARVQQERYKGDTLVPNYQGVETEDWREAQALAAKDKALKT